MTAPSMIDEAKKKAAKDALLNAYKGYEVLLQKCRAVLTELKPKTTQEDMEEEKERMLVAFELYIIKCEELQKIMKMLDKSKYPIFLKNDLDVVLTGESLDDLRNKKHNLSTDADRIFQLIIAKLDKVYTKEDSRREAINACLRDLYAFSLRLQNSKNDFEGAAGPHEHVVEQNYSGPKSRCAIQ
jgi:hypothetical protein